MTDNWRLFIVGWEMVTLTTTLLLTWNDKELVWKYFIIQFLGGSFLLYTIIVAINHGYEQIGPIAETWLQNMFIIGLGVKSAILGLHFWVPLIYKNASPLFGAISSGWVVKLGFITYLKLIADGNNLLLYLGLAMVFYGGIRALKANNYKLLLGFSTISQLGYIAIGIGSGTKYGYIGAVFHIIAHAIAKTTLFVGSDHFIREYLSSSIKKFHSALKRQKLNSIVTTICFISLMGFPLLAGYNSKYLIKHGFEGNVLFSSLFHLTSIVTYLYGIRFLWVLIFKDKQINWKKIFCVQNCKLIFTGQGEQGNHLLKISDKISVIIPMIFLFTFGVFPNSLLTIVNKSTYNFHFVNGLILNLVYLFIASRLFFIDQFVGNNFIQDS